MKKGFQVGSHSVRLPLIQGGMGVGISLSGLASAVAKAGGIGLISTAQIGFREPEFDRHPMEANLSAMKKELEKARNNGEGGVIGFNIMAATKGYANYVKQAIRCGADLIVSGAGLPVDLPGICRQENPESKTALVPIVSSRKAASLICRLWSRRYQTYPDMVVVEGPQAGGHLGFTRDQAENLTLEAYDEEIRGILEEIHRVEEQAGRKIPVAVAGGISCRERASHYLNEIGADAVQIGTRFVTTEECDAPDAYKQAYLNAADEDVRIIQSPVGMPGRAIYNSFLKKIAEGKQNAVTRCHQCLEKCDPSSIPYCITDALVHAARGEMEDALIFCGGRVEECRKIQSVSEVIQEILG